MVINPLIRTIPKIAKIKGGHKSAGILDDFAVRKVVQSKEIYTNDHSADGDKAQVVNVCYGTDATPPTANTVPIGTIYVQYTA